MTTKPKPRYFEVILTAEMLPASVDGLPHCRAELLSMDGPFICTRPVNHPDWHATHDTSDTVVAIWREIRRRPWPISDRFTDGEEEE